MTDIFASNYWLLAGDCLARLRELSPASVDLILTDLPYGTTECKWDSALPLDLLWEQLWRVLKPDGCVVLFCAQPFTSALIASQLPHYKFSWVWIKEKGTGHLNAKKMPMRNTEDIAVFARKKAHYTPQFGEGTPYRGSSKTGARQQNGTTNKHGQHREDNTGTRYPTTTLRFNSVGVGGVHPTQKPVDLLAYLIRTHCPEGGLVLDATMGVGSTGVAALREGRAFIGIERDEAYFNDAVKRLAAEC